MTADGRTRRWEAEERHGAVWVRGPGAGRGAGEGADEDLLA